jgi:outer membrane protein TolC
MKLSCGNLKSRLAASLLILAFVPQALPAVQAADSQSAQNKPAATQPAATQPPASQPSATRAPVPDSFSTTSSSATQPAATHSHFKFEPVEIGSLDATHEQNSSLSMDQLRLENPLRPESFQPIRLEVSFDQTISLPEALNYAMANNLAIKISKDNWNYQRYLFYGQIANNLPNLSMAYNLTHTDILNEQVTSLARVFFTRVTEPIFQGGSVLYSIIGQYYRLKGWTQAYHAGISDELLDVYQKYNNLLLQHVLLQIRGKAVEVSQEQLRVNQALERSGSGTKFAVLQADAQLSADKQALLQQEVAVRQAALALNFTMNAPMGVNLIPVEDTISEQELFQTDASIDALVNLALHNRPELREYEDFKFAAARNIQVAAAPLYPQASLFLQYSFTNTTTSEHASAGGTAGAGVFGGAFSTYQQGFALVWSLSNGGLTSVANLFAANSLSRQAGIQANQELQTVIQQVRSNYLNWRAAREQIDNAGHGARASHEELRLARLRRYVEVATELEVIQAQRDYINSLTAQAQAIVNSNLAQAQLLHDTGIITSDALLHGIKGPIK